MTEPTASELLGTIIEDTRLGLVSTVDAEAALERVRVAVAALEAIRDRCPSDTMPLTHADAVRGLAALTPNTPTKEQA